MQGFLLEQIYSIFNLEINVLLHFIKYNKYVYIQYIL